MTAAPHVFELLQELEAGLEELALAMQDGLIGGPVRRRHGVVLKASGEAEGEHCEQPPPLAGGCATHSAQIVEPHHIRASGLLFLALTARLSLQEIGGPVSLTVGLEEAQQHGRVQLHILRVEERRRSHGGRTTTGGRHIRVGNGRRRHELVATDETLGLEAERQLGNIRHDVVQVGVQGCAGLPLPAFLMHAHRHRWAALCRVHRDIRSQHETKVVKLPVERAERWRRKRRGPLSWGEESWPWCHKGCFSRSHGPCGGGRRGQWWSCWRGGHVHGVRHGHWRGHWDKSSLVLLNGLEEQGHGLVVRHPGMDGRSLAMAWASGHCHHCRRGSHGQRRQCGAATRVAGVSNCSAATTATTASTASASRAWKALQKGTSQQRLGLLADPLYGGSW
mmetsp:Transcript_23345/g.68148  ORF Transcript_23345/g.68148 Transcript_23345/m.68148 type:complete len:393 (+) Transcript_23345:2270-3448(+)